MTTQKFISSYNGEIVLTKIHGVLSLTVNGYVESGAAVETIWAQALDKFIAPAKEITGALILGFAAGSVVPLIRDRFRAWTTKAPATSMVALSRLATGMA